MFNPYLLKMIIDRVIGNKEMSLLIPIIFALLFITVSRTIFGYTREYLFDYLSVKVSTDLKNELFTHIQTLHFAYFDNINTGELMSRIGEDVDNIWRTIAFGFRIFVENAIYFIVASAVILYLNWKLALICIITTPFIAVIAIIMEKKIGETYGKLSDQTVLLNTTAQENIAGVRLVKAFGREKHEIIKFLSMNKDNFELNMEQSRVFAKYFPLIDYLSGISVISVVIFGGIFVIKGEITLGTLVAFTGYIWMLIWPMRMLGWLTNTIAQNNASAKKIHKIMDTKSEIFDKEDAIHLNTINGDIKFNNVSFKYKEDLVLNNLDFNVKAGSTVAIMGTTGSGKSSILNLIGRYYDISEGLITIDGYDIKDISLKDLRSKMAVVSQDTFLFSDTVEANIRFGKHDATMTEIENACKDACAFEFISNLEDGFDTLIGERGIGLSGGQKQRISIARALLRDSSILILDDATSALDMDTEYNLLKNLNNRIQNPTIFIIAHRISAVKNADQILYLENGNIIEKGTHTELIAKKGKYYEIYCEQFKDFENLESEVI